MSYWNHRKPAQRVRAVEVNEITRASIVLLDRGGLRALTVRAVAGQLGVAPASLYSRVASSDDLFDLALDGALGQDRDIERALDRSSVEELMLVFYRHLIRHSWASQVIAMRAPRGPSYLRLSDRMCQLLDERGALDPLGTAYALSNFVIGSAITAPVADSELATSVDRDIAPLYAQLQAEYTADPEWIVAAGLAALDGIVARRPSAT